MEKPKDGEDKTSDDKKDEDTDKENAKDDKKDEDTNKERGFKEIINSPIYEEFIISKEGKTSGILVYIKSDNKMLNLIEAKNNLGVLYLEMNEKNEAIKLLVSSNKMDPDRADTHYYLGNSIIILIIIFLFSSTIYHTHV